MLRELRPRSCNDYLALPIFGPVLDHFCQWSRQRGYTPGTITNQLKDCRKIIAFFGSRQIENLEHLGQTDFEDAWHNFRSDRPATAGTVRQLEQFVREKYGLTSVPCGPLSRSTEELKHFTDYLRKVRGLAESTINAHQKYLGRFLDSIGYDADEGALERLRSDDIDGFLGDCLQTLSRHSLQHVVAFLRSFLRYQFSRGVLPVPLHERIDSPRVYRLEKLPRSLPWATVRQLFDSIDRCEPQGKRNYAILLLIATYGLRSIEVVTLTLDDIDWRGEKFSVRQRKTGNGLNLPLTDDIAEALIDYLRNVRANFPLREVFLRIRAPHGRLKPTAVTEAFQREARRSRLDIPFHGAHCLRHSLAVHLLRKGASMKGIGDLLGHRYASSTSVYLRLAVDDLRSVALDAPEAPEIEPVLRPTDLATLPRMRPCRVKIPAGPLSSFLAKEISAYLKLHRALGKGCRNKERILRSLDGFLIDIPTADDLDGFTFDAWSQTLADLTPTDRRNRMRIVRNFCIFRRRSYPDAFVPDILTFPAASTTAPPFILSSSDISRLLCATRKLSTPAYLPLRPEAIRMAILILYTCGLRRGELLRLRLADFNPAEATLFIRATKFHKQRIIPLSTSVVQELVAYLDHCRQCGIDLAPELPIISSYRKENSRRAYTGTGIRQNWRYLCVGLGILTHHDVPPRLHDIRHSFAVNALLRCYHNGQDIHAKLPLLSTYMGHGDIASTHRYLSFVEPLRTATSNQFEQAFGCLVQPEA